MAPSRSGHALADVPLFSSLPPAQRDELAAAGRVRNYPKGQVVCSEGDPGTDLFVLEHGRVRISRFAATGHEVVLAAMESPSIFGELALIDGSPRAATVIAESDICVRYLSRQLVLNLMEREPVMARTLMYNLAAMVRATNERLTDVLSLDVPGRLAKWLLAQMDESGHIHLQQSQEDIARSIGTTRVSLNRTLRQFVQRGDIEAHNQVIHIRNANALRAIAEG